MNTELLEPRIWMRTLRRLQYFSFLHNEASASDSDDLVQLVSTGISISLVKTFSMRIRKP